MKFPFVISALLFSSFFLQTLHADWIQQNSQTTSAINSVNFINAQTGFATGDNGVIRKTTNGGTNWSVIDFSSTDNYSYVKTASAENIIVVSASSKKILRSTNGGVNWTSSFMTGISLNISKVQFVDFNTGFACDGDAFYRSSDGGITWTSASPSTKIRDFFMVDANVGWCCGTYHSPFPPGGGTNYAQVLRTDNAGDGWQTQVNVQEQSFSIYKIFAFSESVAMYNGFMSGSVARTTNYGSTWNAGASGCGNYITYNYCSFPDENNGWLIASSILKSTNAGANWQTITTPVGNPFRTVFFIDGNTGWFAGAGGVILKTNTGGVTGITPVSSAMPENYKLHQNFPNPFNPLTKIKFEIVKNDFVELAVYNAAGSEVAKLVNENLSAGAYDVTFDAGNLTSGIYYCRMKSGSFSETLKMILLK